MKEKTYLRFYEQNQKTYILVGSTLIRRHPKNVKENNMNDIITFLLYAAVFIVPWELIKWAIRRMK